MGKTKPLSLTEAEEIARRADRNNEDQVERDFMASLGIERIFFEQRCYKTRDGMPVQATAVPGGVLSLTPLIEGGRDTYIAGMRPDSVRAAQGIVQAREANAGELVFGYGCYALQLYKI